MSLVSVWQDRQRPAIAAVEHGGGGASQHFSGDVRHWDVVVVGGGLTGLTTALLLGRAGRSVCLLEAIEIGAGTTGRSTAKVSLLQGTHLSAIASKHGSSVVGNYVEGNREGLAWVERFCADHGVASQQRAAYTYANGAGGERSCRAELEAARGAGLPVEWVDELPLPYPTRGGVRLADQLQVDPMELLDALVDQATAHGVRIIDGVRVEKVSGRQPLTLHTSGGEVNADRVVLATNMPILDRGGFFARMKPARSYGLAFRTSEPYVDAMYLSADSPSRSLRDAPAEDGHVLLVGGNGHTTGRGGSTAQRLEGLRSWTLQHWPNAVETHAWSAQDYVPHHALPYAGPILPNTHDILVAGGFSKWGMTNGVAAALAVTAEILGGHMEWADAMRTYSPHDLRGLGRGVLDNAEVGVEMTRGWLRPLLRAGVGATPDEGGVVRLGHRGRTPVASSRVDGVERRVSAVCTHLGGVVTWNDAERSWDCPLHGSRFGPDGSVLEGPATCGLAQR